MVCQESEFLTPNLMNTPSRGDWSGKIKIPGITGEMGLGDILPFFRDTPSRGPPRSRAVLLKRACCMLVLNLLSLFLAKQATCVRGLVHDRGRRPRLALLRDVQNLLLPY